MASPVTTYMGSGSSHSYADMSLVVTDFILSFSAGSAGRYLGSNCISSFEKKNVLVVSIRAKLLLAVISY